jgi:hypothetical protein
MIFGAVLIFLVLFESYAFRSAHIQFNIARPLYFRWSLQPENNLLVVADYVKNHIPANAAFV